MTKKDINFNMDTLEKLENIKDDELANETAIDCRYDFARYTSLVLNFESQAASIRKQDPGNYQMKFTELDFKRRSLHNSCLSDISMCNNLAKELNLPEFCNTNPNDKNYTRGDFTKAILEVMAENAGPHEKTKETTRDIVDKYNKMVPFNKYPAVIKNGKMQIVNIFSQEKADEKTVKEYIKMRAGDKSKEKSNLTLFNKTLEKIAGTQLAF